MKLKRSAVRGAVILAVGVLLTSTGCDFLKARDELNKGIAAYRAVKYKEAVEDFKTAAELDPNNVNARLYLATAYANQYVPGSEEDANVQIGEQAIAEFQKVLDKDPKNLNSIAGIANLYFQMKRMDQAKDFYKKQIEYDAQNPEPYYSVGVIDWTMAYQANMVLKSQNNIQPTDPIKDPKLRQELADKNAPVIDEGMEMLNKAMDLRPDYDDAMAYVNLLYRQKADLADTPQQRDEFIKTADSWTDKALAIKKAKAAKAANSTTNGQSGG